MVAEGDMEGRVTRAQTSLLLTHSLRVLGGKGSFQELLCNILKIHIQKSLALKIIFKIYFKNYKII